MYNIPTIEFLRFHLPNGRIPMVFSATTSLAELLHFRHNLLEVEIRVWRLCTNGLLILTDTRWIFPQHSFATRRGWVGRIVTRGA
ncbi:hypothetical protein E2C01_053257 [Portunus trituberculatus]|uniref:Uncharacterized protein n=1 Tax=Portunus trituberculatus TaxID=210409 RepID=A0A5B7GGL4_PORTR|nr:hypothetical protein [Portunus trituberculatus]